MLKIILVVLLPFLVLFYNGSDNPLTDQAPEPKQDVTGTLEKMIAASGTVTMDVDVNGLNGTAGKSRTSNLRFGIAPDSFFKVMVFNGELRGPQPSTMGLVAENSALLPAKLNAAYQQLVVESLPWGGQYELAVRDGKTGFTFFDVEGAAFEYDASGRVFGVQDARLLISKEFAAELGRPTAAGTAVGNISIRANMQPIEIVNIVDGETQSQVLPPTSRPESGSVPGPDVIVGDLSGLAQFGSSSGTRVGLAVGTDSCNFGVENLHWFQNPDNDHPVIPQNLYRMSGGPTNDQTFEQVGQSSVKHAFTALTNNICGLGCNGVGGANLGSGCSDPYSANLNAGPNLGSRAWINPFTGAYPRNDVADPNLRNNNHSGHTHLGPTHRILTEIADLSTTSNPGATYYAESQYVTPHEYAWCQTHPGQCNMNNNVSYRQYSVSGTGSPFSFSPVGSTQRVKAAVLAWTGSTQVTIQPDPASDGIGIVAYKVTNPSPGVWHYEYAIFNQNLDRAIQSFSVPVGSGVTLSNVGFHAPPQHPGSTADGTAGNAGFSSAPWNQTEAAGFSTWNSESFAQNPNANAIRWGTLYNFRFDSNRPPQTMDATIGFFKTGAPINVQVQGPSPAVVSNVSVGGRVLRPNGQGMANIRVTITDASNNVRTTYTGSLGWYNFDNVVPGTYTVEAKSSRTYTFAPQILNIQNNITDLDFIPLP
jgi:hypothetical protein